MKRQLSAARSMLTATGGADVGLGLDGAASLGADGQVDCRVGEGACLGAGEEVLDQGREAIELMAGGVPAQQGLRGRGAQGQRQHVLPVLDIDLDLVLVLGVGIAKVDRTSASVPSSLRTPTRAPMTRVDLVSRISRRVAWLMMEKIAYGEASGCYVSLGEISRCEYEGGIGSWQMRGRGRGGTFKVLNLVPFRMSGAKVSAAKRMSTLGKNTRAPT